MHRIYAKPLGYAGDYEMVNMILRDPHEGGSIFAKVLNSWFLSQVPAEAHRNRVTFLTRRIFEECARARPKDAPLRVFNLGCGPAKEVRDFLEQHELSDRAEFTLWTLTRKRWVRPSPCCGKRRNCTAARLPSGW